MAQSNPISASANSAKPQLRIVNSICKCGKPIVGDYKSCGQCNLLKHAEHAGQPLFACMSECGAETPFYFCWHCNNKLQDKPAAKRAFRAKHPNDLRFGRRDTPTKDEAPKSSTKPVAKPVEQQPLVVTTIETDDATIEYREANGNELVAVRLVLAEIEEEEEREQSVEETRRARRARESHEIETRDMLRKVAAACGIDALVAMGAKILKGSPVIVDGTEYPDPHFVVRYKEVDCNFHDQVAAETLKQARLDFNKMLETIAQKRREAEAAARRAKHAPKKDEPKPGKSGGDKKGGKNGKSGGKNKK